MARGSNVYGVFVFILSPKKIAETLIMLKLYFAINDGYYLNVSRIAQLIV